MKVSISDKRQNPSMKREEISFEAEAEGATPSRKELRAKVAALAGTKDDLVVISGIRQAFGSHKALGKAKIYKTKEDMEDVELAYLLDKNRGVKKKGAEAAEAEAPKQKESTEKKG